MSPIGLLFTIITLISTSQCIQVTISEDISMVSLGQLKTNTISLLKNLSFGATQGIRDLKAFAQKEGQFIDSVQANSATSGYLITDKSWRLGLGVISGFSVLACCFVSQLIAA